MPSNTMKICKILVRICFLLKISTHFPKTSFLTSFARMKGKIQAKEIKFGGALISWLV